MRPIKQLPPADYLRECFTYEPQTGELRWKLRPREHMPNATLRAWASWNGKHAGKIAGTLIAGRPHVCLDYRYYWAHRIVWKMMTGEEPPDSIDHKDRNPSNNRWRNLRPATKAKQMWNTALKPNSTTGYRGVKFCKGKFQARIQVNGVKRHLGTFWTAEEASAVYECAARSLHGEWFHGAR